MQVKHLVYRAVGSKNVTVPLMAYNNERATVVSTESYKIIYKQPKICTNFINKSPIAYANGLTVKTFT